jgi:hypothetical protein
VCNNKEQKEPKETKEPKEPKETKEPKEQEFDYIRYFTLKDARNLIKRLQIGHNFGFFVCYNKYRENKKIQPMVVQSVVQQKVEEKIIEEKEQEQQNLPALMSIKDYLKLIGDKKPEGKRIIGKHFSEEEQEHTSKRKTKSKVITNMVFNEL